MLGTSASGDAESPHKLQFLLTTSWMQAKSRVQGARPAEIQLCAAKTRGTSHQNLDEEPHLFVLFVYCVEVRKKEFLQGKADECLATHTSTITLFARE